MVKLRHVNGANLKELEATLEQIKSSIIVVSVNYVGNNWFIHFLVQGVLSDNDVVRRELGFETKTAKPKKGS